MAAISVRVLTRTATFTKDRLNAKMAEGGLFLSLISKEMGRTRRSRHTELQHEQHVWMLFP